MPDQTRTKVDWLKVLFSRRMIVCALMGFACGLPLALSGSLLQAWMKDQGVDLTKIGLVALLGLPYVLKFLWSPLMDRFTISSLGRRRGWLLATQVCLVVSLIGMSLTDPKNGPWLVSIAALFIAFFSASQDIVVDAYRREDLPDKELGIGSSLYVYGYRLGYLLSSGGGLIMADNIGFSAVYLIMAGCMAIGIATTLFTPEPATGVRAPRNFKEAVIDPFVEYLTRPEALTMLAFIVLYKVGDQMASNMTTPFYLDLGFTKTQIGAVVKLFGVWAIIGGGFLGGLILLKIGINRSLWIFGVLQAVSTAGFALLAQVGASIPWLAGVIAFENISSGMGTSAFVAFMASLTNKKFTATQYALLSALMGVPRVFLAAPTGWLAKNMGWSGFFIGCALIAIPGLLLLCLFAPWRPRPVQALPVDGDHDKH